MYRNQLKPKENKPSRISENINQVILRSALLPHQADLRIEPPAPLQLRCF